MADFGATGCVDIIPLDVALENLNLKRIIKEMSLHHLLFDDIPIRRQCPLLYLPMKVDNNYLGFVW